VGYISDLCRVYLVVIFYITLEWRYKQFFLRISDKQFDRLILPGSVKVYQRFGDAI